ncbi:hypothetical protein Tco_0706783 [Tanacetum coccineum]|uniref:Uncharacterized protein n=1 Tax=Tanacetum coccineum TaxID=301880 RepID=A0ABQ4Y9Z5_9ASTR
MHTSMDDYLINTLRFVLRKEASQKYGAILPDCLTSPAMKESKAYKTYLGFAIGAVPPKAARKFKKACPSKKDNVPIPEDEEPVKKGKRLKTATKKSASKPATCIVIREPAVETKSKRKEKEKMKEVHKKSLRDFHKTHPSCLGTVAEDPPSVAKITPLVTNSDLEEHTETNLYSPLDVPIHHEVPRTQAPTFLSIPVSVIPESSPVVTNFPQSSHIFTPTPILAILTPPLTIQTTNPLSNLPDFSSVFQFNDRISALEKEAQRLEKETREEFMNFLSESFTARIKEQVKDQLPQILPQEVSNFAPPVIEKLFHETRDEVTLAKASSQPQSTYEAASTLTEFELKKILLDKMEKSESYLTAPEHRECYDGLKKSYALDQDFFYSYDVYTLKRGRKDKDKDEDPSAGSDRGLKRRKTSKDAEPTTDPKKKDSTSGSSKGTKSQPRSSGKSVQSEEPVFEVADSDMPQDQEGDMGDNEDEPRKETTSRSDWFKKPTPVQEPTDPDWHIGKTTQEGPPQKWLMILATSTLTDNSLKDFDELMSTPIDFSAFIMNGGDYPFDLSKPFPLITRGKRQKVPFEFFINNDLKYLHGGISTMTYTTSTTKTKAAQYDLPSIEDMVLNIWSMQSMGDVYSTKRILAVTYVSVMRKYGYEYLEEIAVRKADKVLYRFNEGDFPRLQINEIEDMLLLVVHNWLNNLLGDDVADFAIALRMLMRSDELYKFSDGMLTRLLSLLEDITKNIDMTYLPKRRWSTLEKKRAHFMIKDINKLLKERRMMRSLEKFVGGRLYGTDLRLLQRTI